ncbi:MAG: hypothetical protein E7515_07460 [Ruminococcaceae bacterium]|jgi:hypothetical protein|nr:hypothetical protein [Oscillospiraceae bacterium]
MAIDSYSEIMEMQRQAMKRAGDISRQEKQVVKNETPPQPKPVYNYTPREPKHTSLPVNIPKRQEEIKEEKQLSAPDADRAMILSILLLLKNEGADEMLLLALLYILA